MTSISQGGNEFLSAYDYQYARKNGIEIPELTDSEKTTVSKNKENEAAFNQFYSDYNNQAAKIEQEYKEVERRLNETAKKLDEAERKADQLSQEVKKFSGEKKYGAMFAQAKDDLQKIEADYAMYNQMLSSLQQAKSEIPKLTSQFNSAKSVMLRDLVIDDDELKQTKDNVGGATGELKTMFDKSRQIKSGSVEFKSRETLEAEGKKYHSVAKNGTHFYEDTPKAKSDSNWLQSVKDFIGTPHFHASDSWNKGWEDVLGGK